MNKINRILYIILSVFILIFVVSCNKENNDLTDTGPELIQCFYTNNLWNVDRIEMLRSDGTRKSSDNINFIVSWLYQVGKLKVSSDPSPEDYDGVAYNITLFHGEESLFFFTPTNINGHVIFTNQELFFAMSSLWNSDELTDVK